MNCPGQVPEGARLDRILPIFEASYRALRNAGLPREKLSGKLLGSRADFVEVFWIHYSLVLAGSLIHRVHGSRFCHHGQIGSACPARRCFFADVMKLTCNDLSARQQADCLARARAAVGSTKLAFGPGQNMIDFVFHRLQRKPSRRLR